MHLKKDFIVFINKNLNCFMKTNTCIFVQCIHGSWLQISGGTVLFQKKYNGTWSLDAVGTVF